MEFHNIPNPCPWKVWKRPGATFLTRSPRYSSSPAEFHLNFHGKTPTTPYPFFSVPRVQHPCLEQLRISNSSLKLMNYAFRSLGKPSSESSRSLSKVLHVGSFTFLFDAHYQQTHSNKARRTQSLTFGQFIPIRVLPHPAIHEYTFVKGEISSPFPTAAKPGSECLGAQVESESVVISASLPLMNGISPVALDHLPPARFSSCGFLDMHERSPCNSWHGSTITFKRERPSAPTTIAVIQFQVMRRLFA
jgi:hypothetical protein